MCRCARTTRGALPTCHGRSIRKVHPSSRDSRLTAWLRRRQKPNCQNASRPGRYQIGMVGEIIGIRILALLLSSDRNSSRQKPRCMPRHRQAATTSHCPNGRLSPVTSRSRSREECSQHTVLAGSGWKNGGSRTCGGGSGKAEDLAQRTTCRDADSSNVARGQQAPLYAARPPGRSHPAGWLESSKIPKA